MSTVNPRFPLFDSLRAIAALSIVALHVAIRVPTGASTRPYLFELNAGVAVFFVVQAVVWLFESELRTRLAAAVLTAAVLAVIVRTRGRTKR